jgi:hypothetical protein
MPVEYAITDEKGYSHQQAEIDAAFLAALDDGPKTPMELQVILFDMGIGNATGNTPLALSYSFTGAIARSATNSLRGRGLIYDSWDKRDAANPALETPFRFYKAGA